MSQLTDTLTRYALDELGAELDGEALVFTDSFGRRTYLPDKASLRLDDGTFSGQLITSRKQLRESLWREAGVNTIGLLSGDVLTSLGAVTFSAELVRSRRNEVSMRFCFHLKRPLTFGGVVYEEIHCTDYEKPTYDLCGGRWAIRADGKGKSYDLSTPMRTMLYQFEQRATQCIRGEAVTVNATRAEAEKRLMEVQAQIGQLEKQAADIQAELEQYVPVQEAV